MSFPPDANGRRSRTNPASTEVNNESPFYHPLSAEPRPARRTPRSRAANRTNPNVSRSLPSSSLDVSDPRLSQPYSHANLTNNTSGTNYSSSDTTNHNNNNNNNERFNSVSDTALSFGDASSVLSNAMYGHERGGRHYYYAHRTSPRGHGSHPADATAPGGQTPSPRRHGQATHFETSSSLASSNGFHTPQRWHSTNRTDDHVGRPSTGSFHDLSFVSEEEEEPAMGDDEYGDVDSNHRGYGGGSYHHHNNQHSSSYSNRPLSSESGYDSREERGRSGRRAGFTPRRSPRSFASEYADVPQPRGLRSAGGSAAAAVLGDGSGSGHPSTSSLSPFEDAIYYRPPGQRGYRAAARERDAQHGSDSGRGGEETQRARHSGAGDLEKENNRATAASPRAEAQRQQQALQQQQSKADTSTSEGRRRSLSLSAEGAPLSATESSSASRSPLLPATRARVFRTNARVAKGKATSKGKNGVAGDAATFFLSSSGTRHPSLPSSSASAAAREGGDNVSSSSGATTATSATAREDSRHRRRVSAPVVEPSRRSGGSSESGSISSGNSSGNQRNNRGLRTRSRSPHDNKLDRRHSGRSMLLHGPPSSDHAVRHVGLRRRRGGSRNSSNSSDNRRRRGGVGRGVSGGAYDLSAGTYSRSARRPHRTAASNTTAAAAGGATNAGGGPATHRSPAAPLSRRPVMTWRSHGRVCAIASVASGQILTGGDASGLVEVWDGRTGRLLCGLSGHSAPVLALLVIPNSTMLLTGSADRTARVWELRTLQSTMVLEGHRGLITALASLYMADVGLTLFTGSDDGTVRQWRAATGACVHVYRGHVGPVNVVASLRPVKYIATGGSDGLFKLWNAQTLRCISSVAAVPPRASSSSAAAASGGGGGGGATAAVAAAAAAAEASAVTRSHHGSHHHHHHHGNNSHGHGRSHDFTGAYGGGGGGNGAAMTSTITRTYTGGAGVVGSGGGSSASTGSRGAVWDIVQLQDKDQSVATATDDGAVRLWASHWNQHALLLKEIFLPGVLLKARSGARCLLACGTHLFVGGARGELYVWDTDTLPYLRSALRSTMHRSGNYANNNNNNNTYVGGGGALRRSNSTGSYHVLTPSSSGSFGSASTVGSLSLSPHNSLHAINTTAPTVGQGSSFTGSNNNGEVAMHNNNNAFNGEGDEQAECFAAAFLFHTAAITGLTRQGAQLVSSSLDHTVCRWDLNELMVPEGDPALNYMLEKGMGMGLAFSAEQGWYSPFSWALRPSSYLAWDAMNGGRGGGGSSNGAPNVLTNLIDGGDARQYANGGGGAALWPLAAAVGGGTAMTPHQQQQRVLLQSATKAPFASPLALLRNPKGFVDGDAAFAAAGGGRDDAQEPTEPAFIELSPNEAAAAYTELPLTFLVEHLRSAAVSPVDVRSVAKALLLVLYIVFFVVYYAVGLAPMMQKGNDITNGLFSQTATYPLPSFARPHTFTSITSTAMLERWLMLMMDQLHSLAGPVNLLVPAIEGDDVNGTYNGDEQIFEPSNTTEYNAEDLPLFVPLAADLGDSGLMTNPVPIVGADSSEKEQHRTIEREDNSGSGSGLPVGEVNKSWFSTDFAPPKATTKIITLPAMAGGVALLQHVRVRVKHVTNTSCKWNRHLLRSAAELPCYGELRHSTESKERLCPLPYGGDLDLDGEQILSTNISLCLNFTDANAGVEFKGLFNSYDSGGYLINLPYYSFNNSNANVLYAPVEAIRRLGLIDDQRTRLVDAALFIYHIYSRTFIRLHYSLEIPRGGAWFASTDTRLCPLYDHAESSIRSRVTLACVVLMLVLLLALMGFVLYEMVMAYYMGKLLRHLLTFAVLIDVAWFVLGMCVIGCSFRWVALSRAVDLNTLLRASVPSTTAETISELLASTPPAAFSQQVRKLNSVATAFNALAICAAMQAVVLLLCVTVRGGRLVTFIRILEAAMRQIRVQMITAAAMMLLSLVSFALAFQLLYGSRHYAYASVGRSLWHLLLYFCATQSVNADVAPPLALDLRITGKVLLFVLNYVLRILCFVYLVSLVLERVQAVARQTPHISLRALLVKWWYDVQYQMALMQQRAPDIVMGSGTEPHGGNSTNNNINSKSTNKNKNNNNNSSSSGSSSKTSRGNNTSSNSNSHTLRPRSSSREGGRPSRRVSGEGTADRGGQPPRASAMPSPLTTSGHRRVIIEHVWRRLRSLQLEQEDAQQRRASQSMSSLSSLMGAAASARSGTPQSQRRDANLHGGAGAGLSATTTATGTGVRRSGGEGPNGVSGRHVSTTSISQFLDRQAEVFTTTAAAAAEGHRGRRPNGTVDPASSFSPSPSMAATAFSRTETEEGNGSHLSAGASRGVHAAAGGGGGGHTGGTATGAYAEAPYVHLQLRLTDLLLLLSEEERTPFARNVIRHAWDSLTWMYHYHQQHARAQHPEERRRRVRLDAGIHDARLRLEPLFAVVRGTQARLEAHEARLRPLAKAVEAMATGEHK